MGVVTSISLGVSAFLISSAATSLSAASSSGSWGGLRLLTCALGGGWAQCVQRASSSGGSQHAGNEGIGNRIGGVRNMGSEDAMCQLLPLLTVSWGSKQLCRTFRGPFWRLHHWLHGGKAISLVRREPLLTTPSPPLCSALFQAWLSNPLNILLLPALTIKSRTFLTGIHGCAHWGHQRTRRVP